MFKQMLKELLSTYGPSGREESIAAVIQAYVSPLVDEVRRDALGSLIAYKRGTSGRKLMFSAHMDQIGLVVLDADEKGFLRVDPVGNVPEPLAIAREVRFENGIQGITYYETQDVKPDQVKFQHIFVDIGCKSREEALKFVQIGDVAVYTAGLSEMGARFASGALDNRVCCACLIEALKGARNVHDVYAVFPAQSEVGNRGAGPAAWSVAPDLCVNLDVTDALDTPKSQPGSVRLGKGPAIKVMDNSIIVPKRVREFLLSTAQAADIPVQMEVTKLLKTDAGPISLALGGVQTGGLSLPMRYRHTPVETADSRDVERMVRLIRAALERRDLPRA